MLSRLISPALAILTSLACALAFSPATAEAAGPGKIVYGAVGKIKMMNADGSNPVDLTASDFSGRDPALSADGQWIAFIALQFPGGGADPSAAYG